MAAFDGGPWGDKQLVLQYVKNRIYVNYKDYRADEILLFFQSFGNVISYRKFFRRGKLKKKKGIEIILKWIFYFLISWPRDYVDWLVGKRQRLSIPVNLYVHTLGRCKQMVISSEIRHFLSKKKGIEQTQRRKGQRDFESWACLAQSPSTSV